MKLLANENFPASSVRYLREQGHDIAFVAEGFGGLGDREVLAFAVAERRWIATFDRDYGELIFGRGLPAPLSVILFRLTSYRPEAPGKLLADLLTARHDAFEGNFVVIDRGSLRIRPLPSQPMHV